MTSIAGRQSFIAGIVLLLALTGCGQSDTPASIAPKYATQTPAALRTIPISDLSVEVSIDNLTKTYQGSDFPDGLWQIEFDLESNQMYDIVISWFALTHLVLEETGQIFTDPEQLSITPVLEKFEFISAGENRFDDDCDGQPNLDEIISGTNPNEANGTTQSSCDDGPVVLKENEFPWILRQHKLFQSLGITSRVISYTQSIQVTSTNPNLSTNFGASLFTGPDSDVKRRAKIDLRVDAEQVKQIRFEISPATDFQNSSVPGARCFVHDLIGIACTIPYEWKEEQWYSLSIEEQSTTSWKAMIREGDSGELQDIGTIESAPNINWYRAQNGISYRVDVPAEQCRLGLAPIGMRYKQGVANDIPVIGTTQIVYSDCVAAGGGWNEGQRTIDDELVYTLTLGRAE